ncbi:MAG: methylated-DNA--[protein]-cysteine S-methyltransferase [Prevotellaceae bacterium]|jgi:methylated-DNA-[protein]-cysteine S-methyltransferase|nr:methylated-DNA--[protein]-cysteine S-methyltransferase [Prevotellaceae bacterium]
MIFINRYESPLGLLTLVSDGGEALSGLLFERQRYFRCTISSRTNDTQLPVFNKTKEWLDCYFGGNEPDFTPALGLFGREYQLEVWKLLQQIPYGQIITYEKLAATTSLQHKVAMSLHATGSAIAHNPIPIIIPCHRVIGKDRRHKGYPSDIERKTRLLKLENADMEQIVLPKKIRREINAAAVPQTPEPAPEKGYKYPPVLK